MKKAVLSALVAVFLLVSPTLSKDGDKDSSLAKLDDGKPVYSSSKYEIHAGLLEPQVREGTNFTENSKGQICGGTQRGKVHYSTYQGAANKFKWYIENPLPDATCTFRISEDVHQSNDSAYVVLIPQETQGLKPDGSFLCTLPSESRTFIIPNDIDCDKCILEWIWRSADGSIEVRQCADILVAGGTDLYCLGQCQNGGVCRHGQCICREGYTGKYCEKTEGFGIAFLEFLKILFYILLCLALVGGLLYLVYWLSKKRALVIETEPMLQNDGQEVPRSQFVERPPVVDQPAETEVRRRPVEAPTERPMNDFELNENMARKLRRDSDRQSYRPNTSNFGT